MIDQLFNFLYFYILKRGIMKLISLHCNNSSEPIFIPTWQYFYDEYYNPDDNELFPESDVQ